MKIITISREFGSGGRELGKRMADILNCSYYDKEIIAAIAKETNMDEGYIESRLSSSRFLTYPITIGHTFTYPIYKQQNEIKLLLARQRVMKHLASQGDCIVMGQAADQVLREYQSLNIFVYADMDAKINRCINRASADEHYTIKELQKKIEQVDEGRSKQYELIAAKTWGRKETIICA